MTFKESIDTVLKQKYATFSGRATRSEYWWFQLFIVLVLFSVVVLIGLLGGFDQMYYGQLSVINKLLLIILAIFYLAIVIPGLAVLVRRFHDRDFSGWIVVALIVASAIPFVGIIAAIGMFVITLLAGTPGKNKYGPDPLASSNAPDAIET